MVDHGELTGFSGSRYNRNMNEGGVDTQEHPAAEERTPPKKLTELEERLRKYEAELDASVETQASPEEQRTVVRKMKDWEQFGWEESKNHKQEVSANIRQALGWGTKNDELTFEEKSIRGKIDNTLEVLLGQGLTGEEALAKSRALLNPDEEAQQKMLDYVSDQHRKYGGDPERYRLDFILSNADHGLGIVRDEYIRKYILYDEFNDENKGEYDGKTPQGLEQLGWQIGYNDAAEFGINGRYPIMQMEVKSNTKTGKPEGRYHVNKANFMRWMRSIIVFYADDKEPDSEVDFFHAVKIPKDFRPVTLDDIIDEKSRYFIDEDKNMNTDLYDQLLKEVLSVMYLRNYDLNYQTVMSSGGDLTKKLGELYYKNKITKSSYGKSMTYFMSTFSLDYEKGQADDKVGAAFTTAFLAYYNLADYKELQKVMGKDSKFFHKDTWEEAMKNVMKSKHGQTRVSRDEMMVFLGDESNGFADAFGEDGWSVKEKIDKKTGKAKGGFSKFVNYFGAMAYSGTVEKVVREALKISLDDQYNFESDEQNVNALDTHGNHRIKDDTSLDMALLLAKSWLRFSGAATRNDVGFSAYDSTKKLTGTEGYRRKMVTGKRGNGAGNLYTIPMFKRVMLDFMNGIRVSQAYTNSKDVEGNEVLNRDGNKQTRKKSLREVFEDMNETRLSQISERKRLESELSASKDDIEAYNAKRKELESLYKKANRVAGQLEFHERAMTNYVANHVARAQKVYDQIMGAKEISFDKFSKYDPLTRRVSFNRGEFQKEIQEDFLKPLRYLFDTFGEVNYSMLVRDQVFVGRGPDGNDKYEFREMPLGEALFGHQILDIPEYRKCHKDAEGKDIKNKWVIDKNGRYEIDYTKLQEKPTQAYKQWALMKLGSDLWTHIDKHSKDPNYNYHYFSSVIDAMESIPAEFLGDEFNMRGGIVTKNFFNKDDMRWLKQLSNTTEFRMFLRGMWQDFRHRTDGGWSDSVSMFLNAVFRGY